MVEETDAFHNDQLRQAVAGAKNDTRGAFMCDIHAAKQPGSDA